MEFSYISVIIHGLFYFMKFYYVSCDEGFTKLIGDPPGCSIA
jgi:hypothetical protein